MMADATGGWGAHEEEAAQNVPVKPSSSLDSPCITHSPHIRGLHLFTYSLL